MNIEKRYFEIKRLKGNWKGVPALKNALLKEITPSEKCMLFDTDFSKEIAHRNSILNSIKEDIQINFEDCHLNLVRVLISKYESFDFQKKRSCGFTLSALSEKCPKELRDEILDLFLNSKEKEGRNRAYTVLRQYWENKYLPIIQKYWELYQDSNAVNLLIDYADEEYLLKHFNKLYQDVISNRYLLKLFERIYKIENSILDILKNNDEITYTYMYYKTGNKLSYSEAKEIFERNKLSDRVGILIWCFSMMNHDKLIHDIYDNLHNIERDFDKHIRKKFGIKS